MNVKSMYVCVLFFFFQAEDGIRDLVRSRGLGDVYKRQHVYSAFEIDFSRVAALRARKKDEYEAAGARLTYTCLLYTSDAADERSSVDLGGRRIIKKKKYTTAQKNRIHDITIIHTTQSEME